MFTAPNLPSDEVAIPAEVPPTIKDKTLFSWVHHEKKDTSYAERLMRVSKNIVLKYDSAQWRYCFTLRDCMKEVFSSSIGEDDYIERFK